MAQSTSKQLNKGIQQTKTNQGRASEFAGWELDVLIDYVLNQHHYYIWTNLPVIKEYALKVARIQGDHFPTVVEVNHLVKDLASDLEQQLINQEQFSFPYIKKLVYTQRDGNRLKDSNMSLLSYHHHEDHLYFMERLQLIVKCLSNLSIAQEPETTPSVLLYKLRAFLADLDRHVYIEKNILFPKAQKLEQNLMPSR